MRPGLMASLLAMMPERVGTKGTRAGRKARSHSTVPGRTATMPNCSGTIPTCLGRTAKGLLMIAKRLVMIPNRLVMLPKPSANEARPLAGEGDAPRPDRPSGREPTDAGSPSIPRGSPSRCAAGQPRCLVSACTDAASASRRLDSPLREIGLGWRMCRFAIEASRVVIEGEALAGLRNPSMKRNVSCKSIGSWGDTSESGTAGGGSARGLPFVCLYPWRKEPIFGSGRPG
jgi:hypothetical protein